MLTIEYSSKVTIIITLIYRCPKQFITHNGQAILINVSGSCNSSLSLACGKAKIMEKHKLLEKLNRIHNVHIKRGQS